MKLRLLTVFIFWALCSISHSANVNFTNMRLTYNQIDPNNGRTMLQLHYTLTVTGLQGHTLVPVLAVEIPQGTFHHFADGGEMKVEGNQLRCNYPSTTFNNQWQAVYIVTELIQIPYPRKMETYIAPSTLVSVNREAIYTQGIRNFVFPNGLKYIAKYAFKGSNVNSIVIPASVLSIDEEAFTGSNRPNIDDGLEGEYIGKMIVTSSRPLKMHANAFGVGYFKNNPTLYVPFGSREDYLSTDGWSDIKNVIEVNFQYE